MKLLVVSVFLDEEALLPTFLESLADQTRVPDRALLVDDGSDDTSAAIAAEFARHHSWAEVLHRPRRPRERDRLVSAAVWTGFTWAADGALADGDYGIVAKMDADLRLPPGLLEEVEARFEADARLGLTGPYLSELDRAGELKRLRWRPEHVGGAVKFYRRQCYESVFPLPPLLNLDMVDEVKARSAGWKTESFEAEGGEPLHLRSHGSHDGVLRGFRRWGRGDYVSGAHPLLVGFLAAQRLPAYPPVLGSLNYLAGWAMAAVRRVPRFDPELRAVRRREQLDRVRERLRLPPAPPDGRGRRPSARSRAPVR